MPHPGPEFFPCTVVCPPSALVDRYYSYPQEQVRKLRLGLTDILQVTQPVHGRIRIPTWPSWSDSRAQESAPEPGVMTGTQRVLHQQQLWGTSSIPHGKGRCETPTQGHLQEGCWTPTANASFGGVCPPCLRHWGKAACQRGRRAETPLTHDHPAALHSGPQRPVVQQLL